MKKILFILSIFFVVKANAQDAISKTLHGLNDVVKIINKKAGMRVTLDSGYLSGSFTLIDTAGKVADDGVIIKIPGSKYFLKRDISQATCVYSNWWPIDGNYNPSTKVGGNSTAGLQKAINFAAKNKQNLSRVLTKPGSYLIDSLTIPAGVSFVGVNGMSEQLNQQGTKFYQRDGVNNDAIICYNSETGSSGTYWWYGQLSDFSIQGSATSTYGYGIIFRQLSGDKVSLQDMNEIRNITIRQFKSGGIYFTEAGGVPCNVFNIKVLWCGGPAFTIRSLIGTQYPSATNFTNCSADGCVNEMFRFQSLSPNQSINIFNAKAEFRDGNPYTGTYAQANLINAENCDSTPISIHGANFISSVDTAGFFKKPGDLVKVSTITRKPRVLWDGVTIRVRSTDLGADPVIISGTNISYKTEHGSWPDQYGNPSNFVTGAYSAKKTVNGAATNILEVNGSQPAVDLVATSMAADSAIWRTRISGRYLVISKVLADGTVIDVAKYPRISSSSIQLLNRLQILKETPAVIFSPTGSNNNMAIRVTPDGNTLGLGLQYGDSNYVHGVEILRNGNAISGVNIKADGTITGGLKLAKTPPGNKITDSLIVKNFADSSLKAIAPLPTLASGSFSSTLTNTTNIASSTFTSATYTRQGNVITARITGALTPTASGTATVLDFTLPVNPGGLTQYYAGTIVFSDNAGAAGYLSGHVDVNASSGTAHFISGTTTNSGNFTIIIQYIISSS